MTGDNKNTGFDGEGVKNNFDRFKILDDKSFLKFISENGHGVDVVGIRDDEMKLLHRAFNSRKEVSTGYRNILKNNISDVIGLKISDKDLEGVDKYIDSLVIADPEKLSLLLKTVKSFDSMPGQLDIEEKRISELEKTLPEATELLEEAIQKRKDCILASMDLQSYWTTTSFPEQDLRHEIMGARARVNELFGHEVSGEFLAKQIADLDKEIKDLVEKVNNSPKEINDQREKIYNARLGLRRVREGILSMASNEMNMNVLLVNRIKASLNVVLDDNNPLNRYKSKLARVLDASEKLDKFNKANESGEWGDLFDVTETAKSFDDKINSFLVETVKELVDKSIAGINPDQNGQFSKLERVFSDILKPERIGNRSREEIKNSIIDLLTQAISQMTTPDDKAKKLLVGSLIKKIKIND